jgi:hypothetical protein
VGKMNRSGQFDVLPLPCAMPYGFAAINRIRHQDPREERDAACFSREGLPTWS